MLGRLWLSVAWLFGSLGVVGFLWAGIYAFIENGSQADQYRADSILAAETDDTLRGNAERPLRVCWRTSEYGTIEVQDVAAPPPHSFSYRPQLLHPAKCVAHLEQEAEEARGRKRLAILSVPCAAVWAAVIYAIYRWGLWVVGASRRRPTEIGTAT